MKTQRKTHLAAAFAAVIGLSGCGGGGGDGVAESVGALYSWMSSEIRGAWEQGFFGQGVRITVIDDFDSGALLSGNLGPGAGLKHHGDWVSQQVTLIAPQSELAQADFDSLAPITLGPGLNVLNLSYGIYGTAGSPVNWGGGQTASILQHAQGGAVVVKAAGNDYGTAVGQVTAGNEVDFLARDLIGAPSALFVGALEFNGSVANKAPLASYSNIAGGNAAVQSQFLVVGVTGSATGLYGTSFAAPVVSGYAAILGSKFTTATPTQIVNQLLDTARTDTILNYDVSVHGQGEASLANALAPQSIQ